MDINCEDLMIVQIQTNLTLPEIFLDIFLEYSQKENNRKQSEIRLKKVCIIKG